MRIAKQERTVALVLGIVIVLAVTSWAVSSYLVRRYQALIVSPWHDPKAALDWQGIDPALALGQLAGSSVRNVFWAAVDQQKAETAYATLVYAIDLGPEERCGLLLALARSEASSQNESVQLACYDMTAGVATAAAHLSDLTRAKTLLEAGRGVARLGFSAKALFYLDQVQSIARFSDQLAAAHRQMLLDELIPLYRRLGRTPESWQALQEQVFQAGGLPRASGRTAVALARPQLSYGTDPVLQAAASRQRMVHEIFRAQDWETQGLTELQRDDLVSVLQHEEQVRQAVYAASASDQPVALAQDRVAWTALKWRVAHRGFGVSLVREWEANATEIDGELRAAQEALYSALLHHYGSVADVSTRRAVLLMQIEYGLLGFYPDWPQAAWAQELDGLESEQSLYVATRTENRSVYFFLAGRPAP